LSPKRAASRGISLSRRVPVDNAVAPIGLVRSLFVLGASIRGSICWTLRFLRCRCRQYLNDIGSALSQTSASLQSFTDAYRTVHFRFRRTFSFSALHFFRGLVPCDVFPAAGSNLHPTTSQAIGYVTPSGFRTLSTPCSPHNLPGLFLPGSVSGVNPPRFYSLDRAVRPLSRRSPLDVGPLLESNSLHPQGLAHSPGPACVAGD
jgi:hypothetical protein